jgi:hypothetical protein
MRSISSHSAYFSRAMSDLCRACFQAPDVGSIIASKIRSVISSVPGSGKRCQLNRSTQHFVEVYSQESRILASFWDVDSSAARPGRAALANSRQRQRDWIDLLRPPRLNTNLLLRQYFLEAPTSVYFCDPQSPWLFAQKLTQALATDRVLTHCCHSPSRARRFLPTLTFSLQLRRCSSRRYTPLREEPVIWDVRSRSLKYIREHYAPSANFPTASAYRWDRISVRVLGDATLSGAHTCHVQPRTRSDNPEIAEYRWLQRFRAQRRRAHSDIRRSNDP